MKKNNVSKIILALFLTTLTFSTLYIFFLLPHFPNQIINIKNNCPAEKIKKIVRGNSLSGVIENGAEIKILENFYDCNEVQRGDIVEFSYAGNPDPIIKIVKGIPGDTISLQDAPGGEKNILINGKILRNSKNETYALNLGATRMLSLYINDYKGIIPENAYLILGNLANGSLDSTRFGLVSKSDILGKVTQ